MWLIGCQINYPTLQPRKNSPENISFSWKKNQDSLELKILGENLQPVFFRNGDTLQRNFTIKSYFFETQTGRKINAWLMKPKNAVAKASVFALHGNSGNLNTQFEKFAPLTDFGFQVFLFDYAGFGYSEGRPIRKNAMTDSFSSFEFFKNLNEVKATKKLIYGQSIGGNFAIPVAGKFESDIEGLVIEGSVLDLDEVPNYYVPVFGKLVMKNNFKNEEILKNYKKPVLVVHSTEDRTIPLKLGKRLFEKANEPKAFLEIDGIHVRGLILHGKKISDKINSLILKK